MPSRFEPCGLSQMYAQKFGSLPIGHQTGGLAETITDGETGFLFDRPSTESFLGGVRRAFATFMAKDRLNSMRRSAMSRSFSWDISAACYSALYRKTVFSSRRVRHLLVSGFRPRPLARWGHCFAFRSHTLGDRLRNSCASSRATSNTVLLSPR